MNRISLKTSCLILLIFGVCGQSIAQSYSRHPNPLNIMGSFREDNSIQDLPAPDLLEEARYTQGNSNQIWFRLPSVDELGFSADTVLTPFVRTVVYDASGTRLDTLSKPVELNDPNPQTDIFIGLVHGEKYYFSTQLVLPVCRVSCDSVTDPRELEFHSSAFADTVWSIQDTQAPVVSSVSVSTSDTALVSGWTNESRLRITGELTDPAGVWQSQLFWRLCNDQQWILLADTTFMGDLTTSGYAFASTAVGDFQPGLPDDCFEFRIGARDAAHTPESRDGAFQLVGNGGRPEDNAPAQASIQIDTNAPTAVIVQCQQILNRIELSWSLSVDPSPGIGLAGYRILRDGELIDIANANALSYVDQFSADSEDANLVYQVQPFDSVANIQTSGGLLECRFASVPVIEMLTEPPFSSGTSNVVCWTGSPKLSRYTVFLAENCDFGAADSLQVEDTCTTFPDLSDGVEYCYWVLAVDAEQRVVRSDTVHSIQDASPPVVRLVDALTDTLVNGILWLTQPRVDLRIIAEDLQPGLIDRLRITLNNSTFDTTLSRSDVDITLPLQLDSPDCEPFAVEIFALDGAENASSKVILDLRVDSRPPAPVSGLTCFQLEGENGIRVEWQGSRDAEDCSGLAGYVITRNNTPLDTVMANASSYEDILDPVTQSGTLTYAAQPFDSLGFLQSGGPETSCDYIGKSSIAIGKLPPFTRGLSQEIHWTISGDLVEARLFIDSNCDSVPEDSVVIPSPGLQAFESVENLQDGIRYCYWMTGVDSQRRDVISNQVASTQDNTAPVIEQVTIRDSRRLNDQIWAFAREIQLDIRGSDMPPGQIMSYEVVETNGVSNRGEFANAVSQLDDLILYKISEAASGPSEIQLTITILDGAGNASEAVTTDFIFQEGLPNIYAFPNPFNPMAKEIVIRVKDVGENEIRIFDFFGNLVRVLTQKHNQNDFVWDGKNGSGEIVANGGYICVGRKTGARFKIGVMKQL